MDRRGSKRKGRNTVPLKRSFVVEVVAHDGGGVVEYVGYFVIALAIGDNLGQEVDVVPSAGFDELLLYGGTLQISC